MSEQQKEFWRTIRERIAALHECDDVMEHIKLENNLKNDHFEHSCHKKLMLKSCYSIGYSFGRFVERVKHEG